ncbi:MAG: heat-inducible transcriptional repressor HrcA [Nitrospirota bacterium]
MHNLSDRNKKILTAIVQSYINTPDPVGSRVVTKRYALGLSPATIRNIMADLEEMGFLIQPHTSAGRVPTDLGYRFYVDSLVAEDSDQSNKDVLHDLYRQLETLRHNIDMLLGEATKNISILSHYLGVAMSPSSDLTTLKRIDLLKYAAGRIAVVLFTDEGVIKNRVLSTDQELSQRDLARIAGYLNSEFAGYSLDEIRMKVLKEMSREKVKCDRLLARAMQICRDVLSFPYGDLFISGLSGVLDLPDFNDLKKIRELSRAIEDKHMIIRLLDELSATEGVQVIIGSENTLDEMKRFSVVASACRQGDRPVGIVGIIGPTRMNYARAIYIVENTAKFITKMLEGR